VEVLAPPHSDLFDLCSCTGRKLDVSLFEQHQRCELYWHGHWQTICDWLSVDGQALYVEFSETWKRLPWLLTRRQAFCERFACCFEWGDSTFKFRRLWMIYRWFFSLNHLGQYGSYLWRSVWVGNDGWVKISKLERMSKVGEDKGRDKEDKGILILTHLHNSPNPLNFHFSRSLNSSVILHQATTFPEPPNFLCEHSLRLWTDLRLHLSLSFHQYLHYAI
jgi:hypothetical protein